MGRKILVDFGPRTPSWVRPERKYGGQGVHDKVEEWEEGVILKLEGHRNGRKRSFLAAHRRSSTGSGLGTFRIDEVLDDGKVITHGYHCSYPDFDACVLVARENRSNAK